MSPDHATANVFYAATRLLVLPNQPAGSNFLSRLGVSAAGRNLYSWAAVLPTDTNGVPLAPATVNATESTAILRTNLLPAIIAAEANLAAVTDTSFTVSLTAAETHAVAVTLDYGDIQMLRAILQAAEYAGYNACSQNIDFELTAIRSLYDRQELSISRVLKEYPDLLTFTTTNDLVAAESALLNSANNYLAASQFIRNRPATVTRLFNLDSGQADDEEKFRVTLSEITNSLVAPVTLSLATNYSVFLGSQFRGEHSLRSFLPWFQGNAFGLGTLPDPTFGELISGISGEQVDEFLGDRLAAIPTLSRISGTNGELLLPLNVDRDEGYAVQVSTNLVDWSDFCAFYAFKDRCQVTDSNRLNLRFYRLVDRTDNMPPPANDNFANRAVISQMNTAMASYTTSATREPAETNWDTASGHTIWWSWTSPVSAEISVMATGRIGGWFPIYVFTGSSLSNLSQITAGSYDVRFSAQAGVTYQIAVDSWWRNGGVQLLITRPPVLVVNNPAEEAVFIAPANILIDGVAYDPDGQLASFSISGSTSALDYRGGSGNFSLTSSNMPAGYYWFDAVAIDSVGCRTEIYRTFRIHSANDDFSAATPIIGAPLTLAGSNVGANKEPGEPDHAEHDGGASVWWAWSPSQTGPITVSCNITNQWGAAWPLLGVYTGNSISNLTCIASNWPMDGVTASVSFTANSGQLYRIAVDRWYGNSGGITLQIRP